MLACGGHLRSRYLLSGSSLFHCSGILDSSLPSPACPVRAAWTGVVPLPRGDAELARRGVGRFRPTWNGVYAVADWPQHFADPAACLAPLPLGTPPRRYRSAWTSYIAAPVSARLGNRHPRGNFSLCWPAFQSEHYGLVPARCPGSCSPRFFSGTDREPRPHSDCALVSHRAGAAYDCSCSREDPIQRDGLARGSSNFRRLLDLRKAVESVWRSE